MNEIFNRVTAAIARADGYDGFEQDAGPETIRHYSAFTRAALEALRGFNTEDFTLSEASGIRQLIDSALEEPTSLS